MSTLGGYRSALGGYVTS